FAFLNSGLALGVWLLFDENVAKPIDRLAADLRLRAHAGVEAKVDRDAARYLGDLAPAAEAVSTTLTTSVLDSAAHVARETERLQAETLRLTALLTEIPVAMILVNPAHEIVLYDGQAADLLSRITPPRLKAPLTDYFDPTSLSAAQSDMAKTQQEVSFTAEDPHRRMSFSARLKPLEAEGYMMILEVDQTVRRPAGSRPLVYDFGLLQVSDPPAIQDSRLSDLCLVAFDTETTGLFPAKDDVVQIGAVRILKGGIVAGETFDSFVDPGRPIPPDSTRIHHITDADVAGAPDFVTAGRAFHTFAKDAVLVAHNAPFDLAFLRRAETDMGVAWDHPVLDTVLLSAVVFGTTEVHTLDALCDRLGIVIPPDLRHSALGDAQATAEVVVKLIPLLAGKGLNTFGDVIRETRKHGRLLEDLNDTVPG
ncbi:MAG: 3'-5' exonuclease, partial [Pseudomonadota bacterium]